MIVSVAMATYNGAKYLRQQLDSLSHQTRLPDELVVTDDGSTDETTQIVKKFAQSAPFRVTLLVNESTLGYSQNFGKAISLCSGDVVFPCDQDDWWFERKIQDMLEYLRDHPQTSLVLCDTLMTDAELMPSGESKLGNIRSSGLPDTAHVMGCCIGIRRNLVKLVLPVPQEVPAHDNWMVQLADELGVADRLDVPLQYYRIHGKNASAFFVNRSKEPSHFATLRDRLARFMRRFKAVGGMAGEHALVSQVYVRLKSRSNDALGVVSDHTLQVTKKRLEERVQVLTERLRLRSCSWSERSKRVLHLWRAGAYPGGNGLIAAVKDILIRAPKVEVEAGNP